MKKLFQAILSRIVFSTSLFVITIISVFYAQGAAYLLLQILAKSMGLTVDDLAGHLADEILDEILKERVNETMNN